MKEKRRILAAIAFVAIFSITTSTAALSFPTGTFVHGTWTFQFNAMGVSLCDRVTG